MIDFYAGTLPAFAVYADLKYEIDLLDNQNLCRDVVVLRLKI